MVDLPFKVKLNYKLSNVDTIHWLLKIPSEDWNWTDYSVEEGIEEIYEFLKEEDAIMFRLMT